MLSPICVRSLTTTGGEMKKTLVLTTTPTRRTTLVALGDPFPGLKMLKLLGKWPVKIDWALSVNESGQIPQDSGSKVTQLNPLKTSSVPSAELLFVIGVDSGGRLYIVGPFKQLSNDPCVGAGVPQVADSHGPAVLSLYATSHWLAIHCCYQRCADFKNPIRLRPQFRSTFSGFLMVEIRHFDKLNNP